MNKFLLKDNQIMIFTDFNKTLVDFENEYNFVSNQFDEVRFQRTVDTKANLSKCLAIFEKKTGLEPVICIITNASMFMVDSNYYEGITQDLNMTFFNHLSQTPEHARSVFENSCEKYFKYLIYKENDVLFKINPLETSLDRMFEAVEFPDRIKQIRLLPQFKKQESVLRMIELIDPMHQKMPRAIFAGDSIKDDYPMVLADTQQGTSKIFIRPGKVQKMKPSIMAEFCRAAGHEFSSVHPRTYKKIQCFDEDIVKILNEQDSNALRNYSRDGVILLTHNNSRGFVEGLYKAIDLIVEQQKNQKCF